jgi:beta-galactosidase
MVPIRAGQCAMLGVTALRAVSGGAAGRTVDGFEVAWLTEDGDQHRSTLTLQFQPVLTHPGSSRPDHPTYQRVVGRFSQAATDECVQVRIVHPDSDWTPEQVLVVPALYIADDALLERLVTHARAGTHVVLTFRTGYADEFARVRWRRQPGPLREAVGAWYQEYTTVPGTVPLTPKTSTVYRL